MTTQQRFRESRTLRTILDEFLESAEKIRHAREVLYGERTSVSPKSVQEAVNTIYIQIPILLTAAQSFERVIDNLEDEEAALKESSHKKKRLLR